MRKTKTKERSAASIGASLGASLGAKSGPFGAGLGAGFGGAVGYIAGALTPGCGRKKVLPDGGQRPDEGTERAGNAVQIPVDEA